MDTLISVLFFVAIVLFQVIAVAAKRAKKQKPADTESTVTRSGSGGVLGRVFSQIRQELERAAREAQAQQEGRTGWEQLMAGPPTPAPEAPVSSVAETRPIPESRRPEAAPQVPVKKRSTSVPPAEEGPQKPRVKAFAATERARVKPAAPKPAFAGLPDSVAELRRAFVWSEILGPPLALRKTQEDRWNPDCM